MTILYIAIGGAAGAVLRYLTMSAAGRWLGVAFPYGTLAVNIVGSLAMGMLIGMIARFVPDSKILHPLLAVGFLGSYTTFSTFSLDVITMAERGELLAVCLYIAGSVTLALLALFAGLWLVRIFTAAAI